MALKFRICNSLIALGCMAVLAATPTASSAQGQTQPVAPGQPKPGKISEADLQKLKMLELKSGARTKAPPPGTRFRQVEGTA